MEAPDCKTASASAHAAAHAETVCAGLGDELSFAFWMLIVSVTPDLCVAWSASILTRKFLRPSRSYVVDSWIRRADSSLNSPDSHFLWSSPVSSSGS